MPTSAKLAIVILIAAGLNLDCVGDPSASTHVAPQETIMLDEGVGLAAADRFALERRKVGDSTVLHYRAKPD